MRHILLLLLLTGVIACKKSDSDKPASFRYVFDGSATALRNGIPWEAKVTCGYFIDSLNDYVVRIATLDENGDPMEYIGLGPFSRYKTYINDTLTNVVNDSTRAARGQLLEANYTLFFGPDLIAGPWNLDLTRLHYISLTYDSVRQMVSGTFEAGFWIGVDTTYSPWARPVYFTNGVFSAPMHHYQLPDD